jgi:hypothetical protein
MENNQGQAQSQQTSQSKEPQTAIPADNNWHDFNAPVSSFKSPVGCEIEPLSGTFGRVRSLEQTDQTIEVSYNAG